VRSTRLAFWRLARAITIGPLNCTRARWQRGGSWETHGRQRSLFTICATLNSNWETSQLPAFHLEESLGLRRALGDGLGTARTLQSLCVVARLEGDHSQSAELGEEPLTLFLHQGNLEGVALALIGIGLNAQYRGDRSRARTLLRESLRLFAQLGDRREIAECLELLAGLEVANAAPARAARLFGAAAAALEGGGLTPAPTERYEYEQNLNSARRSLGERAFAAAWPEGQSLPLETAIADALGSAST
jgi:hypothetical protein